MTEAACLYPLALSTQQQGTLPPGASHIVNGVEIPPQSDVVMCIYAENLKMGESFDPDRWKEDPTDTKQFSATFAGCPYNNGKRDLDTQLPLQICCPSIPLIRRIVAAFATHLLSEVKWLFQDLPSTLSASTDYGVMYPNGMLARVSPVTIALPKPVWPASNHRTIRPGSKVAVVGGSIGGIVAAREFQARGCEVRVIEAAHEIGGGK